MRRNTAIIHSLERALKLLQRIVDDRGRQTISALALDANLPVATAHRIVATFRGSGHLIMIGRGRFAAGPALVRLGQATQPAHLLAAIARPALERLARQTGQTAHLGVFEDNMVTYLVKSGRDGDQLFTREGMQLEAYCSGIGKVLLAHLPDAERERYLDGGPFIALTHATVIDPARLRRELLEVRLNGFAVDDREVSHDLVCLAVPVPSRGYDESVAISVSTLAPDGAQRNRATVLKALKAAAAVIADGMDAHCLLGWTPPDGIDVSR